MKFKKWNIGTPAEQDVALLRRRRPRLWSGTGA